MPIANCYFNKLDHKPDQLETLTKEWSLEIGVELKDICLTFVDAKSQQGQQYKVMINLFLPSLWSKLDISKIQKSLLLQFIKHLHLQPEEIFIITNMVQSGNVIENGKIVEW